MRILIIEDETNTRDALKKMLKLIVPNCQIVGETGFVKEAQNLIKTQNPEVVLLDIELEDGTGFELLESLDSIEFKLIFTTAYNQFAIKAFKFSAMDYLMKPIDPTELKTTFEKLNSVLKSELEQYNLIETLKDNFENKNKKIVLKTSDYTHIINTKNIVRLEADGAYTTFITDSKKIIISKNLKYYEELLDENFIRCHQSHIVNSNKILSIDKNDILLLSNSDKVPVSSRKKTATIHLIKGI